jgi:ribosomal protein S18 acetylase RimI-like enzyme
MGSTGNEEMEKPVEIVQLALHDLPVLQSGILNVYHVRRQGFRCLLAREIPGGAIVGFAYGYTSRTGQWWHDIVEGAMPAEQAVHWLAGAFELVELGVLPEAQGQGIGARLHDRLLVGLPHKTAVLSTMQVETRALQLYRRRGWVPLLENFHFPGVIEPYMIMGLELTSQ